MGKICVIFMTVFLAGACMSEVKPLLKPTEVDIPNRIANLQKWVDEDIALAQTTRENAFPIQKKLYEIKVKYNGLLSAGPLTAKDSETINRMLDETSDALFRLTQKRKKIL